MIYLVVSVPYLHLAKSFAAIEAEPKRYQFYFPVSSCAHFHPPLQSRNLGFSVQFVSHRNCTYSRRPAANGVPVLQSSMFCNVVVLVSVLILRLCECRLPPPMRVLKLVVFFVLSSFLSFLSFLSFFFEGTTGRKTERLWVGQTSRQRGQHRAGQGTVVSTGARTESGRVTTGNHTGA